MAQRRLEVNPASCRTHRLPGDRRRHQGGARRCCAARLRCRQGTGDRRLLRSRLAVSASSREAGVADFTEFSAPSSRRPSSLVSHVSIEIAFRLPTSWSRRGSISDE
jgi:hypothetical protein